MAKAGKQEQTGENTPGRSIEQWLEGVVWEPGQFVCVELFVWSYFSLSPFDGSVSGLGPLGLTWRSQAIQGRAFLLKGEYMAEFARFHGECPVGEICSTSA